MVTIKKINDYWEYIAIHHISIQHNSSAVGSGNNQVGFVRTDPAEFNEGQKSELANTVLQMKPITGSFSVEHAQGDDMMRSSIRIMRQVEDTAIKYGVVKNLMNEIKSICNDILSQMLIDFDQNGETSGWVEITECIDLRNVTYVELLPGALGGGWYGMEMTFNLKAQLDLTYNPNNWV